MNYREQFNAIMHYGDFDRMPVVHWKAWPEVYPEWHKQGLPENESEFEYFRANFFFSGIHVNVDLFPLFEEETIEDNDEYRLFRDGYGVVMKDLKHSSAVPHYTDWTLKSSKEWPEFKKRLQPDSNRIPDTLDARIEEVENNGTPICLPAGSMMGWIRNWMGVEGMTWLMFDEPDCFADMVDTLSDLACWAIDEIMKRMNKTPDIAHGWEDICGSSGPFVSPSLFDAYVAPGYRKIRAKLDEYGVPLYSVDSDGDVRPLIKNWLDAGVNVMFPLEPGTWGASPEETLKQYGKELRIIGGFDKLALTRGRDAIDKELAKHYETMKKGGLLLMPDHLIVPGTPLADYTYYLEKVRQLRF